jgi:hypothetical protein
VFRPGDKVIAGFPTGDPDAPRVAVECEVQSPAYTANGKVRIKADVGQNVYTAAAENLRRP